MRKKSGYASFIAGTLVGTIIGTLIGYLNSNPPTKLQPDQICAWFTEPKMFRPYNFIDCESKIIALIDNAKANIYVQSYSWTSAKIAKALVKASNRGVIVKTILDKENESHYSSAMQILVDGGLEVRIRRIHGISHNKVMIFDNKVVLTGSYNFTQSANEKNDENILVVSNESIAQKYIANWEKCYKYTYPVGAKVYDQSNKEWGNKGLAELRSYKTPLEYLRSATKSIYIMINNNYIEFLNDEIINYLTLAINRGILVRIGVYNGLKYIGKNKFNLPIKYLKQKSTKSYIVIDGGTELSLMWSPDKSRYIVHSAHQSHAKAAKLDKIFEN